VADEIKNAVTAYLTLSHVDYVRWQLKQNGLNEQEIRDHLLNHEQFSETNMTNAVPKDGGIEDWRAVLQEAHQYILHYSTVRLGLVTFLITASSTALSFSLPKETVQITSSGVTVYHYGSFSGVVFAFSFLFFIAAFFLNREFDRRRYVMERYARDVELILDAKIQQKDQTTEKHSLEIAEEEIGINAIIAHNNRGLKKLRDRYAKDCVIYAFLKGPPLNRFITVLFLFYLALLIGVGIGGSRASYSYKLISPPPLSETK
jgi:hypothetical protein